MLDIKRTVVHTLNEETNNPFVTGAFRPNFTEYTADTDTLKVTGEIPKDLNGVYVRNTHNPVHDSIGHYHPFDGDAMLHALHFEDGKATYRNRFVETTGFLAEQAAGRWPGLLNPDEGARRGWGAIGAMKDNAGTDVHCHAGMLIAVMSQRSEPWRLDPVTMENFGPDAEWAFKVGPAGVTAHYKVDTHTGEMMFFNFSETYPYMSYGVVDRDNKLQHYVPIELDGPRWPHDLGVTQNYSILHADQFTAADARHAPRPLRRIPEIRRRPHQTTCRHGSATWFCEGTMPPNSCETASQTAYRARSTRHPG
jgi:carotenoid cleavage dioxygenase-like enzyme